MFGVMDIRDLDHSSSSQLDVLPAVEYLPELAGGSACFGLQLICLVKLHTVSSSLVGVGTIKYPLMAPHGSSHPASGSAPPVCVSIVRLCFLFAPCVFHWRCAFHRTCVVCFICRLVGLVSRRVRGQPSLESCRMWKL